VLDAIKIDGIKPVVRLNAAFADPLLIDAPVFP
jgi:hypothetical protein